MSQKQEHAGAYRRADKPQTDPPLQPTSPAGVCAFPQRATGYDQAGEQGRGPNTRGFYRNGPSSITTGIRGSLKHRSLARNGIFGGKQLVRTIRRVRETNTAIAISRHNTSPTQEHRDADQAAPREAGRALPKSKGATLKA